MTDMNTIQAQFEKALTAATQAGADGARLKCSSNQANSVNFDAGRLKSVSSRDSLNYSLEVLKDGRIGRSRGNDLDRLLDLVAGAMTLTKTGSVAHFDNWPAPADVVDVPTHSDTVLQLSTEKLVDDCRQIADAFKTYNPDLFIEAGASRQHGESLLMTSAGIVLTRTWTRWSLSGFLQRTEGTDMLFAGVSRSWNAVNEYYDPQAIIDECLNDARLGATVVPAPRGKLTAFFPPDAVWMLLQPLMMGINGRRVAKGESPLATKLGDEIMSRKLTIIDNPHVPFSNGSAAFDSDGIPTRKQALIEDGRLIRFLYDLDSAGLAGVEPTGNSGCSPYFTIISPGSETKDEILADIDNGIMIKNLMGFGQGNLANGDFSCNVGLGYKIENGKIVGRIKDTMVSGNMFDLLKNVRLGRETNYTGQYPWIAVEGMDVSA